ncbi:uncharacterized protein LODBEIA_P27280 [Lodderomyces beijingensis]|uniref:RRM domain-containing protein n=1 Tax=Lodderomyces beijingensis TaxID=1775926 RepID=A0ABP0ZK24_9ASCO
MNKIKQINQINQKELASNATTYKSSWHYDYRDTNYIYIGNIPFAMQAHQIIAIFSQYGVPTHLNLVRDRDTGKHRGFAFLKYANFKSCILAIDNFNGIKLGADGDELGQKNGENGGNGASGVGSRMLSVDHTYYKLHYGEKEDDFLIDYQAVEREMRGSKDVAEPAALIENETVKLIEDKKEEPPKEEKEHDNEDDEFADPMASFINNKNDRHGKHKSSHRKQRSSHRSSKHKPRNSESRTPSRGRSETSESSHQAELQTPSRESWKRGRSSSRVGNESRTPSRDAKRERLASSS